MKFLLIFIEFHEFLHELERDFAIFELWPNVIVFDCCKNWTHKFQNSNHFFRFCAYIPIDSRSE